MAKPVFLSFAVCFLLLAIFLGYLTFRPLRPSVVRKLNQEEIKPKFKIITGKELPDNIGDIKSILYIVGDRGAYEEMFIAIHTNKDGCIQILKIIGDQDIKKINRFPKELLDSDPLHLERGNFLNGYYYQKEHGLELFDHGLINQVNFDCMSYVDTGQYPENAVADYFLYFKKEDDSKWISYYYALFFINRGIIYIDAVKTLGGTSLP